jgi:iron complex transport system ATP-binding protein
MSLLATEGARLRIGGRCLCTSLDLAVEPGQCWGLLGPNGAGKTTLLHTLAGLRPLERGTVRLRDRPLADWRRRAIARHLGVLFQEPSDPFPATVWETVRIGRHPHSQPWIRETASSQGACHDALEAVGLAGARDRLVHTLSGGERRRLAWAVVLAQDPAVFLLDEPTNHLDLHFQMRLLKAVTTRVRAEGRGLVMALHDINMAARFCDHLLFVFGDGRCRGGRAENLLVADELARLYGHPIRVVEAAGERAFLPG